MTDWNALIWLIAIIGWLINLIFYMGNREYGLIKKQKDTMRWQHWCEIYDYRMRVYKHYGISEEFLLPKW